MKWMSLAVVCVAAVAGTLIAVGQQRVARVPAGAAQAAAGNVSPGQAALERAAAAGKYLFILFWKEQNQQTDQAWGVLQSAVGKTAAAADCAAIQITDPAEKSLVDRYGVSRAPMPFVLAVAPNGAVTKGLPGQFDENQLRQAFVSPCTAECMKALQDRKLVLLCVENQSAQVRQASLQKGVEDFTTDKEYAQNSKVVVLHAGDPAEGPFLKDLKVDPQTTVPVTVLMAPPGSVIGTFAGQVTKEQLVAKLKAAQSSCCPGGQCGPGGGGPK
jgi:hypothetical protein